MEEVAAKEFEAKAMSVRLTQSAGLEAHLFRINLICRAASEKGSGGERKEAATTNK